MWLELLNWPLDHRWGLSPSESSVRSYEIHGRHFWGRNREVSINWLPSHHLQGWPSSTNSPRSRWCLPGCQASSYGQPASLRQRSPGKGLERLQEQVGGGEAGGSLSGAHLHGGGGRARAEICAKGSLLSLTLEFFTSLLDVFFT